MRYIPFAIVLILVVVLVQQTLTAKDDPTIYTNESPMLGKRPELPALPAIGVDVPVNKVLQSEQPMVLNIFASWCTPCLAEHPYLMQLADGGVPVIGIAWSDTAENISRWLGTHGNPYGHLWLDEKGNSSVALGLRGVPETYIIQKGEIVFHHAGVLTEKMIEHDMLPLLRP